MQQKMGLRFLKMAQGRKKRSKEEHTFQIQVAAYLALCLTDDSADWTSHECNLPLGYIKVKPTDSAIRQACIKFYNNIIGGVIESMSRRGFRKGWGDVLIQYEHVTKGYGASIWFELKSKGGRIQPHQKSHAEKLERIGIPTVFPRSLQDVKAALIEHGVPHRNVEIIA